MLAPHAPFPPARRAASQIAERRDLIARAVVAAQFSRTPAAYARYGASGREKCLEDLRHHVLHLAEAVGTGSPALFCDYAAWVKSLFAALGIPVAELRDSLGALGDAVAGQIGGDAATAAAACIDAALAALETAPVEPPGHLDPDRPHAILARAYLDALLAGDRRLAMALIADRVDRGLPVRDAYLHVFQPVLREVGRLWQSGRIGVAHEHFATAATEAAIAMLYPRIFATPRIGRTMVATCVSGEQHEIGLRMVSDFFEMAGWDTYYLGADAPASAVVRAVADRRADVLAVSATITAHLGAVEALIAAVRTGVTTRAVRIIAGGHPFNVDPDLWRRIGADGSAASADDAVRLACRLAGVPAPEGNIGG